MAPAPMAARADRPALGPRVVAVLAALACALGLGLADPGPASPPGPPPQFSLEQGLQIVQTLADPARYSEYFPDTDRWLPTFGRMLREYKVPVILFNFGLVLLVLGVAFTFWQAQLGRLSPALALLRLVLAGAAWQTLVIPPQYNGCTEESQHSYPCTLQTQTKTKTLSYVTTDPATGGYVTATKTVAVEEPAAPELPLHQELKSLFKDVFLNSANQAVIASLKNEGKGIKRVQTMVLNLSLLSWTAASAGAMSESVNPLIRCGLGAAVGVGTGNGGVEGCAAATAGLPEIARSISSTMGTVRTLLVMGPLVTIATFHALNTLAGGYLYSVLFFMGLLVPLALFVGPQVLLNAFKYVLVALLTPLVSGVLLSTGMSLTYNNATTKIQALEDMAKKLQEAGIPPGAAAFAPSLNQIATRQLYNLYRCLEADAQGLAVEGVDCAAGVAGGLAGELARVKGENPAYANEARLMPSGFTALQEAYGVALKNLLERVPPAFAAGSYRGLGEDDRRAMYGELKRLFGEGRVAVSDDTKGLLAFFQRFRGWPDLGANPGESVRLYVAASGGNPLQGGQWKQDFEAMAFDPAKAPEGGVLEAKDTWASGTASLGLMNRLVALQVSSEGFQLALASAAQTKALNMAIVTILAAAITIAMLVMANQLLAALFGAMIAGAGNTLGGLFLGAAGGAASVRGAFRPIEAPAAPGGGGGGSGGGGSSPPPYPGPAPSPHEGRR